MSIAAKCVCGHAPYYCTGGNEHCLLKQEAIEETPKPKPMRPRPQIYSCIFPGLQEIAKEHGYNLLLSGSLNRDCDLVAVPWVDKPSEHLALLIDFEKYLCGYFHDDISGYNHTILPGGRDSYFINMNRGGRYNNYFDEQYYVDISITPLFNSEQNPERSVATEAKSELPNHEIQKLQSQIKGLVKGLEKIEMRMQGEIRKIATDTLTNYYNSIK